ncbi:lasso peptide biosynthesis B2 protein [Streptomyces sp. M19]
MPQRPYPDAAPAQDRARPDAVLSARDRPRRVGVRCPAGGRCGVRAGQDLAHVRPEGPDVRAPGAVPATAAQALRARRAVVAVSRRCASHGSHLQRSIAVALLCRAWGSWPTWCTGCAPTLHPHAWIEAEGRLIGEPHPPGHYRPLFTVPGPSHRARRGSAAHVASGT